MKKTRVTNADLLKKIEALEREVAELKKVAHPQSVMADPELTDTMKRISEFLRNQQQPSPEPQYAPSPAMPLDWRRTTHCGPQLDRVTLC